MTSPQQELLLIRLGVLDGDIDKVAGAVERAKQRGRQLDRIIDGLGGQSSVTTQIGVLRRKVDEVAQALDEDDLGLEGGQSAAAELSNTLAEASKGFDEVYKRVKETRRSLQQIRATIVALDERVSDQDSLDIACHRLHDAVEALRKKVSAGNLDARRQRELWREYETLLVTRGRPLFGEYVDFLGGLTVRDTGLDDRVSEMSDVLLGGFKTVTRHYLPIPARKAALSSALDSVVKLGFPEWTVWGVPLVAHEVGLALARNPGGVPDLLDKWTTAKTSRSRLCELFADVFGAYTVGPAYGYAALLLRLHPHHDEVPPEDEARDVDRARLVLATLRAASEPGSDYRRRVNELGKMWQDAVITLAGPERAAEAEADAGGQVPEDGWLDEYLQDVLQVLDRRGSIERFDETKLAEAKATWGSDLDLSQEMWGEAGDVLGVLNLAWVARVTDPRRADEIGERVQKLWETRTVVSRGGRRR